MISETSKCRLTNETRVVDGMKLYRIQAIWDLVMSKRVTWAVL